MIWLRRRALYGWMIVSCKLVVVVVVVTPDLLLEV